MPAQRKFHDGVSVTLQMEREARDDLQRKANKRDIFLSDILNERLKSLISHIISLVK